MFDEVILALDNCVNTSTEYPCSLNLGSECATEPKITAPSSGADAPSAAESDSRRECIPSSDTTVVALETMWSLANMVLPVAVFSVSPVTF